MSELTIYKALRAGGLSKAGACAVMGNMFCESSLKSNIVETRCSMSGFDYTNAVDTGTITKYHFMGDSYGYGLCQWTYFTRKGGLWDLAKNKGVSIANEEMQCQYCIQELKTAEFADLYTFLCDCGEADLHDAVELFCTQFEKPAVNNIKPRFEAATRYFAAVEGESGCGGDACPVDLSGVPQGVPYVEIGVPPLKRGDTGRHVSMLQAGLKAMGYYSGLFNRIDGDFGEKTEAAVKQMQKDCNQPVTGVVNQGTWQVLFQ